MDKVEVPIIACNDGLPHPHRDREQTTPGKLQSQSSKVKLERVERQVWTLDSTFCNLDLLLQLRQLPVESEDPPHQVVAGSQGFLEGKVVMRRKLGGGQESDLLPPAGIQRVVSKRNADEPTTIKLSSQCV